jgi:23S rRNA pseudouridine1911/1915/1917 synthase
MNILEEVRVVAEFADVVAVDKPAGLIVHGDGRSAEANLCDWITKHYPQAKGVGEPIERDGRPNIARPGIVHRLDRDTSGVMLIALTQKSYLNLKQQFKNRTVEKTYEAFVYGRVTDREFVVDDPIGRSSGDDFRKQAVAPYVRGKARHARTDFFRKRAKDRISWVEAMPKTGRTHQIRVHLKSLHQPIVCDSLYASGKNCFSINRQALHAAEIRFTLSDGSEAIAAAGLPADIKRLKDNHFPAS